MRPSTQKILDTIELRRKTKLCAELMVLDGIAKIEGATFAETDVIRAGGVEYAFPETWKRYKEAFENEIREQYKIMDLE